MTDAERRPTYDLAEIQRLVKCGPLGYRIEPPAVNGAGRMGLDETDIIECVAALNDLPFARGGNFYKTMPGELRPGTYHDVYKTTYDGQPVYCKLQLMITRSGNKAAVISFKEDESP
jgi:hypothetical protein